jgi:hypothetical protein
MDFVRSVYAVAQFVFLGTTHRDAASRRTHIVGWEEQGAGQVVSNIGVFSPSSNGDERLLFIECRIECFLFFRAVEGNVSVQMHNIYIEFTMHIH